MEKIILELLITQSNIFLSGEGINNSPGFIIFNTGERVGKNLNINSANEIQVVLAEEMLKMTHPVIEIISLFKRVTFEGTGMNTDPSEQLSSLSVDLSLHEKELKEKITTIFKEKLNLEIVFKDWVN